MHVPKEPTPLTDEALRLIGVIAVESARLEWQLAGLLASLEGLDHRTQALWISNKDKVKRIVQAFEANPSWSGVGPTEEAIRWAVNAGGLLRRRGDLMHSTWIVGADEGTDPMSSHLGTGNTSPIDIGVLTEFADEIHLHTEVGPVMWLFAMNDLFESRTEEGDGI